MWGMQRPLIYPLVIKHLSYCQQQLISHVDCYTVLHEVTVSLFCSVSSCKKGQSIKFM